MAKHRLAGILLFVSVLAVFYASPVSQLTDSKYSVLLSETILRRHSVDLSYAQLKPDNNFPESVRDGRPYQTIFVKRRLLYYLGWGSSLLTLPAVAALNAAGISAIGRDGSYNRDGEMEIQRLLAALLAAGAIWVIFGIGLSAGLPASWAVSIAICTAFATQVWSTASRALWSQTVTLLLVSVAIWHLLSSEDGRTGFRPALTATLLSWMYFVRPASSTAIILISIYVLLTYPDELLPYIGAGSIWLAGFVVFSLYFFGTPLPPYYHETWWMSLAQTRHRLAGLLLSPSRGLLVYCPIVLFVLYLVAVYWRSLRHRRLVLLALGVIVVHLALLSTITLWWGGWSYGPRELTDTVPFFAMLGILGCRALLDDTTISLHGCAAIIAAGMVLFIISAIMNAPGALCESTLNWNAWANIGEHRERLWDWRHAQFVAALGAAPFSDWISQELDEIRRRLPQSAQAANHLERSISKNSGGPVIDGVNGVRVVHGVADGAAQFAPVVLLPSIHNALLSWWDADVPEPVVITGHGFDTRHGVGVGFFCACSGTGNLGPFFLNPGNTRLEADRITVKLPRSGSDALAIGSALLIVRNGGADHKYSLASNPVWVSVGAPITVRRVLQSGSLITVEGSGFSPQTIVNLYVGRPAANLGGLDAKGKPRIPPTLIGDSRLTFIVPADAEPGPAYVEVLNPPYQAFSSSFGNPGGEFALP